MVLNHQLHCGGQKEGKNAGVFPGQLVHYGGVQGQVAKLYLRHVYFFSFRFLLITLLDFHWLLLWRLYTRLPGLPHFIEDV